MSMIYENKNIKIEVEESEIPWFKIFTQFDNINLLYQYLLGSPPPL